MWAFKNWARLLGGMCVWEGQAEEAIPSGRSGKNKVWR